MTTTETPAEQYRRLMGQYIPLSLIPPGQRTPEEAAAYRTVQARLIEIDATPPADYTLPAVAARLVEHARTHHWRTQVQWAPPGTDEPSVRVMVGRPMTPAEREEYGLGDRWQYFLTWSSRGCPPGRLRQFGSGTARTPDHPADHGAPSVRAITAIITARPGNPA